jgi:serine protease Do
VPGVSTSDPILPGVDSDLAAVAAQLRRVTVQVHDGRSGVGSGVIWTSNGVVVTNAHVVQRRRARVVFPGGRSFEARLLAWDPDCDLAVLVSGTDGLTAADVGDSDGLRVGELVVAVGHPFGLAGAVTAGVIHAIPSRRVAGPSFIEADLRLAPGNSGGPLADSRGRVIGINARIAGGLALAVPSNVVIRFLSSLRRRAMATP